jgi:hypothetical protein
MSLCFARAGSEAVHPPSGGSQGEVIASSSRGRSFGCGGPASSTVNTSPS